MRHRCVFSIVTFFLTLSAGTATAQTIAPSSTVAVGVGAGFGFGPGIAIGPTVGAWYGPYYGPGLWGWGGPWGWGPGWISGWGWGGGWTALPWVPGWGWQGINPYGLPAPTVGPTPGAFSATGGYGIGGGVYGAQRDLPTIIPKGNGPLFATRDVRRHFDEVKANPQIAIDRAYRDRALLNPYSQRPAVIAVCKVPTNRVQVLVRVPAEARVWIDDTPTTAQGTERLFESQAVTAGQPRPIQISALIGGQLEIQSAVGKPGELTQVTFTGKK